MNKLNFWEWLDRVKMSLLFFFGILVLLFSFALLMGFRFLQDQLINQGKYAVIVNQEREKRDQDQVKVENVRDNKQTNFKNEGVYCKQMSWTMEGNVFSNSCNLHQILNISIYTTVALF